MANVRDGFAPQTNVVHVDGKRGVVAAGAEIGHSTLDIVNGVKDRLAGASGNDARVAQADAAWPINRSSSARRSAAWSKKRPSRPG